MDHQQIPPIRDVLDRIGDTCTVLMFLELKIGPRRFNALRRGIEGDQPSNADIVFAAS